MPTAGSMSDHWADVSLGDSLWIDWISQRYYRFLNLVGETLLAGKPANVDSI